MWYFQIYFNQIIFMRKEKCIYIMNFLMYILAYVLSFKGSFAYFSLKVTFVKQMWAKYCWNSNQLSFEVQKLMQRWFQFASDNCVCTSARSMRLYLLVVAVCKSRKAYAAQCIRKYRCRMCALGDPDSSTTQFNKYIN